MITMIMTADDYAQSAAIDTGILNLVGIGKLTAFSCLTLSPRWTEAATHITPQIRQAADIGLHLDFTQYAQPLRHDLPTLIVKTIFRRLDTAAIRQAIHAQLDAFEQALGMPPDYIDGHQHVHQLPQIRQILVEVLLARYPARLPWLRIARPPLADGLKGMVIRYLGASALQRLAAAHHIRYSNVLLGVYGFNASAADYLHKLRGWFQTGQRARTPVALMCHPALGVSRTEDSDPIYTARLVEYEVLSSVQCSRLMAEHRVTLARGTHEL